LKKKIVFFVLKNLLLDPDLATLKERKGKIQLDIPNPYMFSEEIRPMF